MAGGWPSRIVGRSVGLRGGTARQSRPRGSVLGSAASRCVVDYPLLPHSLTASSVALTFSTFARPLDSRRFSLSLRASPPLSLVSSVSRFSFAPSCFGFALPFFVSLPLSLFFSLSISSVFRSSFPLRLPFQSSSSPSYRRDVALFSSRTTPCSPPCISSALSHTPRGHRWSRSS